MYKEAAKKIALIIICIMVLLLPGCSNTIPVVNTSHQDYIEEGVTIRDMGNYFDVVLDYTSGLSLREMGRVYAQGILTMVPNFEYLVDTYIAENITHYEYSYGINRTYDIIPQIPQEYFEEIEGMALVFSGEENAWKDGKISRDEIFMYNLFADVFRVAQCSYVSVYGSRSESGSTITARNLDWFRGTLNQLPQFQAVITIKYPDRQVCSVGYLGYQGILTGINDSRIFAGILDSGSNAPYTSEGRRSYTLDLRYALENYDEMDDAAEYMRDSQKLYSFNHIIGFSDPKSSMILENNFSGDSGVVGNRVKRALRYSDSPLNRDIEWGITDAVASVNSFILYGNHDNHTQNQYNTKRWNNIKTELIGKGDKVSFDNLRELTSYYHGRSPGVFSESGDIYNMMTIQMIVIEPATLTMEVYFPDKTTISNPKEPVFIKIPIFQ